LIATNSRRAEAGSAVVALDTSVASKAQAWADTLLKRAAFAPSTTSDGRPATCGEIVFEQKDLALRSELKNT